MGRKTIWTEDAVKNEALKYKARAEFKKMGRGAFGMARKLGILDDVCSHMPKHARKGKWTVEKIKEAALKYETRNEFYINDNVAHLKASKLGILDDVCSHMKNPRLKYSYEDCLEVAKQYKYRLEFRTKDYNIYHAALRRGILNDICSHMPERRDQNELLFDLVYLVHLKDNLYKIGVTSSNTSSDRFSDMKYQLRLEHRPTIVVLKNTEDAFALESKLLKYGTEVEEYLPLIGGKEVRKLTQNDYNTIWRMLNG